MRDGKRAFLRTYYAACTALRYRRNPTAEFKFVTDKLQQPSVRVEASQVQPAPNKMRTATMAHCCRLSGSPAPTIK